MRNPLTFALILFSGLSLFAREYHVSVNGNDANDGTAAKPLKTISAAAFLATAGDVVTVHAGTYRELVNPLRGGESDEKRVVFRASPGEEVNIKGSEIINTWQQLKKGIWKVVIPNSLFGDYNPYIDTIAGDWFDRKGMAHHTGEVYINGKSLFEVNSLEKVNNPLPLKDAPDKEGSLFTWYCVYSKLTTTIWANFHGHNPNKELTEINVRPTCFYPSRAGINYLTIRGFKFSHAATQWAPPTAEQIGLIATNWCKGWIIENNTISDSKCTGITLGKERASGQNVWSADKEKDGAIHYIEVIFRVLRSGWSKQYVGSHIVRNNTIYDCEQAGICGSFGAAFSQILNNHIYNIYKKRQFDGDEIAGIKLHAPIDVTIKNNRIHDGNVSIYLDWMTQGTRISGNLLYNNRWCDLLIEVSHGPFLVDNNIMLSKLALYDESQGGSYVHNLIAGKIFLEKSTRFTPYLLPHSTEVAGFSTIVNGDTKFYNNIIVGNETDTINANTSGRYGLEIYKDAILPVHIESNLYFNAAKPYPREVNAGENKDINPDVRIEEKGKDVYLHILADSSYAKVKTRMVSSTLLGKAQIPDAAYENPDGTGFSIDVDFFGAKRSQTNPLVGPFESLTEGQQTIKVW